GVDGVMIGRASIGYPWIFNEIKHFVKTGQHLAPPTVADRIIACRKHLDFSIQWKGDRLGIFEMRRHYANYFKGLPDFKQFRMRFVVADSYDELLSILHEVSEHYDGVMA
ncbi:MAG: tRNA dihydrouridine synthase DusB, partial [Cytophagaceae bacterium]